MSFKKVSPNWQAEGVEPPNSLKQQGFVAGYKPPATYFNWLLKRLSECITELQIVSGGLDKRTSVVEKITGDIYSKNESKDRFGLTQSVIFDENFIPLDTSNKTYFSTGNFLSYKNDRVKYIYVSSDVTVVDGGAVVQCPNLTDIYIDNAKEKITVSSSAFPSGVAIHYLDDFNATDKVIQALLSINEAVNASKDFLVANYYSSAEIDGKLKEKATLEQGEVKFTLSAPSFSSRTIFANYTKVGNMITFSLPEIEYRFLPNSTSFALVGIPDNLIPINNTLFSTLHSENYPQSYQDNLYFREQGIISVVRQSNTDEKIYFSNQDIGGFKGGVFTYLTS